MARIATPTIISTNECAVDNLIDLDDNQSTTPSFSSPNNNHITVPNNKYFIQNGFMNDDSGSEQFFEGVANGKKNGYNNLLDSPLNISSTQKAPSTNSSFGSVKRLPNANALASQLYHGRPGGSSTRSNSRRSSMSDELMSVSDQEVHTELSEISNHVQRLEQHLSILEEQQLHSDDRYVRMKQENAVLQERLHNFEEQVQASEERWRQRLADEEKKHKELSQRLIREKSLELDSASLRLQILEKDHGLCQSERQKLKGDAEQWRKKCARLETELKDYQEDLMEARKEGKEHQNKTWRTKEETDKRLKEALLAIDDYKREIEELRMNKDASYNSSSDYESELSRLREEHKVLKEKNNELHAELLQASVEQGCKLIREGPSLADELDGMSKDQILNALKEQEIVNQKLRVYVDGILLRIIEMYPAILEIKPGEKDLNPFK